MSKCTLEDTKKILMAIAAAYGPDRFKVDPHSVRTWHAILKDWEPSEVSQALKQHITTNTWPPAPASLLNLVRRRKLPVSLTWTAIEALDNEHRSQLLIQDAREFADRVAKGLDPEGVQYGDRVGELDQARRMHRLAWEREFKKRFQDQQGRAIDLVEQGIDPRLAICRVVDGSGIVALPEAAKEILGCSETDSRGLEQVDRVLEIATGGSND